MEKTVQTQAISREPKSQPADKAEGLLSKVLSVKIGVIPLPVYIVLALVIVAAAAVGQLAERHDWRLGRHHDYGRAAEPSRV